MLGCSQQTEVHFVRLSDAWWRTPSAGNRRWQHSYLGHCYLLPVWWCHLPGFHHEQVSCFPHSVCIFPTHFGFTVTVMLQHINIDDSAYLYHQGSISTHFLRAGIFILGCCLCTLGPIIGIKVHLDWLLHTCLLQSLQYLLWFWFLHTQVSFFFLCFRHYRLFAWFKILEHVSMRALLVLCPCLNSWRKHAKLWMVFRGGVPLSPSLPLRLNSGG